MLQEGEEVEQVFARDNFFPSLSGLPVAVHQEQALCEEITEYVGLKSRAHTCLLTAALSLKVPPPPTPLAPAGLQTNRLTPDIHRIPLCQADIFPKNAIC